AGFLAAMRDGAGGDWPLIGVAVVVTDGKTHPNDSSDDAFRMAASRALKQAAERATTVVLEPIMRVVAEAPEVRPGVLASTLLARGGVLLDASEAGGLSRAEADVPLARMLGFAATLRSATAGGGTFAMEPRGYAAAP
ncbi:MAG: elongation factor G, partial [Myxococcales bacterium]|nr:elongation factor G [Myxococcales bacterium]